MDKNDEIKLGFFFSRIRHIKNLTETEKTKLSIVLYEATSATCILRICKNRDVSAVCEVLLRVKNPHIATVYQYVYAGGNTYILEEMLSGKTLEKTIAERGSFSESETARIISDVCDGLAELHNAQPVVVHNDIKPSNIMICTDNNVKLFDFDVSRTYKKERNQNTTLFGTEGFASPEHYGYGQSEPRTDIYSLGVTMHKMLTGMCLSDDHSCTYNGSMKKIIEKCVEVDPEDRYASVFHLKSDLDKIINRKNHIALIALIISVAVIICAAAILILFFGSNKDNPTPDTDRPQNMSVESTASVTTEAEAVQTTGVKETEEPKKVTIAAQLEGKLLSMIALNDGSVVYLEKAGDTLNLKKVSGETKALTLDCDKDSCRLMYNPFLDNLYLVATKGNQSSIYSLSKTFDMNNTPVYSEVTSYLSNVTGMFFSDGMLYCNAFTKELIDTRSWQAVGSAYCSSVTVADDRLFDLDSNYYMLDELNFNGDILENYEIPGEVLFTRSLCSDGDNLYLLVMINKKMYVYTFDGQKFSELICLSDYLYYTDFEASVMAVSHKSVWLYDADTNVVKEFTY